MADRDSPIVATDSTPVDPPATDLPADQKRRWPRWLVITLRVIGGIFLAIFLAWAILYITKGRFLKGTFERIVSKQTGREVKVAGDFQFYFNPINLKYVSEGLTISNPAWVGPAATRGDFFAAKRIEANVATLTFIFGKRRVNILDLQGANVDLRWDDQRRRNSWTFSEEKGEPLDLPLIRRAVVAGTRVRYRDPAMLVFADIGIDTVEARDTQLATAIRFSGRGEARRTPFRVSGALLTPNATVSGGENRLALRIDAVRTRADISGTLPGATEIEGAKLTADVRGSNLADAFAVAGIAVPDTRAYRLRSALTKQGNEWRFTGLRGRFGDSDLAGRMTVRLGEPRLFVDASLTTRTLDIVDAGPFVGYSPRESETGEIVITAQGRPRILPDAPLRVEALKNFDARVDWKVARVRADKLPLSDITLGLTLDDRLLKLSPLNFGAYPMSNGLTRIATRFLGEPESVEAIASGRFDRKTAATIASSVGLSWSTNQRRTPSTWWGAIASRQAHSTSPTMKPVANTSSIAANYCDSG